MAACRGKSIDERFDSGELRGNFPVHKIPYVGPFFSQVFQDHGLARVRDVISHFSTEPALSPREIEQRLGVLFMNPSRGSCLTGYHVADVNICGFNRVLRVLQYAHAHRHDWEALGFAGMPNIPNANLVPMRSRGSNRGSRVCACRTPARCEGALCRLQNPEETGLAFPVCTPREIGNGFRGTPEIWDEENQRPLLSQFSTAAGEGPAAFPLHGRTYVGRWRVLNAIDEGEPEESDDEVDNDDVTR